MSDSDSNSSEPRQNTEHPDPDSPMNVTRKEESNFANLFFTALTLIIEFKNLQLKSVNEVIQNIIDSFHFDKGNRFTDVDYGIPENVYGFFYRYGVLSAGVTRHRILEALSNCQELQSQLSVPSIKIISLGSGPGCDIIGLCSALHDYKYKRVELTLVDKYKSWLPVFNIVEFLTREGKYGKASLMFQNSDVSTTFLRKDLADDTDQNEAFLSALKGADIVLLSRLFSILPDDQKEPTAKTVTESMKPGATLIVIESSKIACYTNKFFDKMDQMYGMETVSGEQKYYVRGAHPRMAISTQSNAQIYVMKQKKVCIY